MKIVLVELSRRISWFFKNCFQKKIIIKIISNVFQKQIENDKYKKFTPCWSLKPVLQTYGLRNGEEIFIFLDRIEFLRKKVQKNVFGFDFQVY